MRSLAIGLLLSLAIAYPAYRRGSLTRSGLLAALFVGALVMGLGGAGPGLGLLGFFLTGTALSHHRLDDKRRIAGDQADKGERRDAQQVLANGGVAALCCALYAVLGGEVLRVAALGSLAAATADTWATEIGVLSRGRPRMLLTLEPAAPGTSGAVSGPGLLGMAAGAALLSALAAATTGGALAVLLGGVAGGMLDSLLGQAVQERRACAGCGQATERRVHGCGRATAVTGGVEGVDNDVVNALATLGGAVVAALLC